MFVRDAAETDLPAIMAIHNDVVRSTTAIYEDRITELGEWHTWYDKRRGDGFPVLVADDDGEVAGLASYGSWRARSGYRHTVEDTIHVRADRRGRGIGRMLLDALIACARSDNIHVMVAHIDANATVSVRLHRSCGFEHVGTFRQIAQMRGQWLNLVAMQLILDPDAVAE